ncbi:MAG: hypothetical protein IJZ63_04250 [Clostridia bacterium]|nr:hypothetical protein [Clostridia bacterium]
MDRNKIKQELKYQILATLDDTGELPTLQEIKDYLNDFFGLGDEAEEFIKSIL